MAARAGKKSWLGVTRGPGLSLTEQWLITIGLVIGVIHLVDVLSANAEDAAQFIPAVILWIVMVVIWVVDRPLQVIWDAIGLIMVSIAWAIGGAVRHIDAWIRHGDQPAAVTGTFSTAAGLVFIALAVMALQRWRRSVRSGPT